MSADAAAKLEARGLVTAGDLDARREEVVRTKHVFYLQSPTGFASVLDATLGEGVCLQIGRAVAALYGWEDDPQPPEEKPARKGRKRKEG